MAKRDLIKTANKVTGLVPERYDLTWEDMQHIKQLAEKDLFGAISLTFKAGFTLGHRATVAGKYKEQGV